MNFDLIPDKIESLYEDMKIFSSRVFVVPNFIIFWVLLLANGYYIYDNLRGERDVYLDEANGAICRDGWRSHSQGPGTCSWHGGVDKYIYSKVFSYTHYPDQRGLRVLVELFLLFIVFGLFFSKTAFYIQMINWLVLLQGILIIIAIPIAFIYMLLIFSWRSIFLRKKKRI